MFCFSYIQSDSSKQQSKNCHILLPQTIFVEYGEVIYITLVTLLVMTVFVALKTKQKQHHST